MSLIEYQTYSHNPFRVKSKHFYTYTNLKEVNGVILPKENTSDNQTHIRIFPEAYDDFRELNSMAIKILSYSFNEIKADYIRLNAKELAEEFKCSSRNTIYRGIKDLLDKKFIVRKNSADMYFINPNKFFKGARADWYLETQRFDENYKGSLEIITYE